MAYNITWESYNQINNGRIELRQAIQKLKDVVHPDLLDQLVTAEQQMHQGLRPVFDEIEAEAQRWEEHVDFVEKLYGPFPNSYWSMREVPDLLEHHPFEGAWVVRYSESWSHEVHNVPIQGNKWVDLWIAANEAMRLSGDDHHIFIESLYPLDDAPGVLELVTGS